jgi:hypothetical protein
MSDPHPSMPSARTVTWLQIVGHNPGVRTVISLALAVVVACGATGERPASPDQVTGLITSIGRGGDGSIQSFTVDQGGRAHEIRIDPGRNYGFDLEHLEVHRVDRLPVRVRLTERRGELFATEILDA